MKEARFWEASAQGKVHCRLCPHQCRIATGASGRCNVRHNRDGVLYASNYGVISGLALDPMEKKPLYHFYPGSQIVSVGSRGCNLACGFCQNWASVSGQGPTTTLTAQELADLAADLQARGNCGVAFTYTEPLMWYEFVRDAAPLIRERGLKTVLVTNGFIEAQPWQELLEHIDAVNIDLKAFTGDFYRKYCQGRLEPVQQAIALAKGKCHLEITTLLVEGHNTEVAEIRALSAFIADLDPNIPLHLSRYHPTHHWRQPATSPDLIRRLAEVAREQLNHVYTGNLPDSWLAETSCPHCGEILIRRGPEVRVHVRGGNCPRCLQPVNIQAERSQRPRLAPGE